MSSIRRRGREAAVQWLYASEVAGQLPKEQDCTKFWELCVAKPAGREFAEKLVKGVLENLEAVDREVSGSLHNYEFGRLAAVDRNILRVAAFELLFDAQVPAGVAINEAIEIAKDFGGSESGRFVHGVLDEIRRRCDASRAVNADSAS